MRLHRRRHAASSRSQPVDAFAAAAVAALPRRRALRLLRGFRKGCRVTGRWSSRTAVWSLQVRCLHSGCGRTERAPHAKQQLISDSSLCALPCVPLRERAHLAREQACRYRFRGRAPLRLRTAASEQACDHKLVQLVSVGTRYLSRPRAARRSHSSDRDFTSACTVQCVVVSLVKKTVPPAAFATWTAVSAVTRLTTGPGRCAGRDAEAALHHANALHRVGGAMAAASRTCTAQQVFLLTRDVLRWWGDGSIQRWWKNSHYSAPPCMCLTCSPA